MVDDHRGGIEHRLEEPVPFGQAKRLSYQLGSVTRRLSQGRARPAEAQFQVGTYCLLPSCGALLRAAAAAPVLAGLAQCDDRTVPPARRSSVSRSATPGGTAAVPKSGAETGLELVGLGQQRIELSLLKRGPSGW